MFKIAKLNNISNLIYNNLTPDNYLVSEDVPTTEADAILLRSADCLNMELTPNINAFARAGIGVNNIDVEKCTSNGIVVFNTPGANANAVKELVLCGLLLGSRDIVGSVKWVDSIADKGDEISKLVEKGKKQFVGPELKGKTLGVIGLGAIGVAVSNMATHLGMNVIGYDPYISIENAWNLSHNVVHSLNLDDLLAKADYITIHVPFMKSTANYLDAAQFEKMKDGVVILNYARNGLINEEVLLKALEEGKVSRYLTDFPDEKLLAAKNVVCTPHLGASTPESEENCAEMASLELKNFLETGEIKNSVNFPACPLSKPVHVRMTVAHDNIPGIIGDISSVLGDNNINVEEMVNKSRNTIAYSVFDLNKAPSDEIITSISAIDGVIKVRIIK